MIKNIVMPLLAIVFLAGAAATLTACNTVEGMGKDIQQGGAAIKDEAAEHKNY
ncbi:MAG TPA: entericidin A/B family lipoprotein [Thiobacillaceae bacterium]|nr:entericidin A/B family lipoprotein [Thiobacillaceae bacterium]